MASLPNIESSTNASTFGENHMGTTLYGDIFPVQVIGDIQINGNLNAYGSGHTITANSLATSGIPVEIDTSVAPIAGQSLVATGPSSAIWQVATGGLVSGVSLVTANGFSGNVTNPTSTPAITISTTVTGLVKGNGNALSAATIGTDYVIPSGNITGTSSNVTGTVAILNGGTGSTSAPAALTALGAYAASNPSGYTNNTGTVTSVGSSGTVSGITLSGTVTTTGSLALGGTLAVLPSNFTSQTQNTFLAAPSGSTGVPTFRTLVALDVPTLNQSTTGTASFANNLNGGLGGQVHYQSALNTTAFLANGTAGQILQSNGTTLAPTWVTPGTASTTAALSTTGASVNVSLAAPPTTGQVLTATSSTTATWQAVTGSVSSISVVSANGLAGTSSGGSTPALTLSTSITGILKGNGTAISAATAGTDYVIPSGSITGSAGSVAIGNVTGMATGASTFLVTPSSANLAALTTDETGTGALVFATSPTLVTPAITGNTTVSGTLTVGSGIGQIASGLIPSGGFAGYAALWGGGVTQSANNWNFAMIGSGAAINSTSNTSLMVSGATVLNATSSGAALAGSLSVTGAVTGAQVNGYIAMPANAIDLATGIQFSKTISGATTFTIANVPATGSTTIFSLELTNGGSAVITWWASIKWAAATAPTLTTSGRDLLTFITHDGGTTWSGAVFGLAMA